MKINLSHIVEGWSKSLGQAAGLYEVPAETAALSVERLKVCATCPLAQESSFLKIFKSRAETLGAVYCTGCGCPVNEKSLVLTEKCPENKWPK